MPVSQTFQFWRNAVEIAAGEFGSPATIVPLIIPFINVLSTVTSAVSSGTSLVERLCIGFPPVKAESRF